MKNQNGISMLEVMVAISMMGAAAVYFMKFQSNQMRQQKSVQNQILITQYVNDFKNYFSKPGICGIALKDKVLDEGLKIEEVKRSSGQVKYKVGDRIVGSSYAIKEIRLSDVYFDEMKEGETSVRAEGLLVLVLNKVVNNAYGAKELRKSFEIDFSVDKDDKIIDCAPLGHLVLPNSGAVSGDKNNDSQAGLGEDKYDDAFNESVNDAMKSTNEKVDQHQINNAIKGNSNLQETLKSIENIKKVNERMKQILNES